MKPESYPFLKIARKHGVDYGKVLNLASQYHKLYREEIPYFPVECEPWFFGADDEMRSHTATFLAIQRGEIDWNTGQPILPPQDDAISSP